jgi:hypothetical protein
MSVKLTDAQLVMMSAAAQREDRCLAVPETMKGAAVGKVGAKLVKRRRPCEGDHEEGGLREDVERASVSSPQLSAPDSSPEGTNETARVRSPAPRNGMNINLHGIACGNDAFDGLSGSFITIVRPVQKGLAFRSASIIVSSSDAARMMRA